MSIFLEGNYLGGFDNFKNLSVRENHVKDALVNIKNKIELDRQNEEVLKRKYKIQNCYEHGIIKKKSKSDPQTLEIKKNRPLYINFLVLQ